MPEIPPITLQNYVYYYLCIVQCQPKPKYEPAVELPLPLKLSFQLSSAWLPQHGYSLMPTSTQYHNYPASQI